MQYGARNKIKATVKTIQKGDVMSLVTLDIAVPAEMGSVITTESLKELDLKPGDTVTLIVKAVNVLPVKE